MNGTRLFGRFHPSEDGKVVDELTLRILVDGQPDGATTRLSDVQLQPGRHTTGWNLHPSDLDVQPIEGWQFRNGTVYGDMTVIVIADTPSASPMRLDVHQANGTVRVGGYHFGKVTGAATVNGATGTATQGAGIAPHVTRRADIDLDVSVQGRARLTAWFRGFSTSADGDPPPVEDAPDLPPADEQEEP